MYIFIFLVILSIIFIFYTPKSLSNYLYGFLKPVRLKYIITNNPIKLNKKYNVIDYEFIHRYFDGDLMNLHIKDSTVTPKKQIRFINNPYKKYQIIPNQFKLEQYSSFTQAVAYIIKKLFKYRNCDITDCPEKTPNLFKYNPCKYRTCKSLKIGIVVSKRHLLKNQYTKGNFLKFATYTVYSHNTFPEICDIHYHTIKKTKYTSCYMENTTFNDIIKAYDCDIIFNSWRNLTNITRNDGTQLVRVPENLNKQDLINKLFKTYNKNMYVKLDYYETNWIISFFEKLTPYSMGYE